MSEIRNPRGAGRKPMADADKKQRIMITVSPEVAQALKNLDAPASQVIDKALRLLLKIQ